MKKLFALMLILLFALSAGCITDSDDDGDDGDNDSGGLNGGGTTAAEYFPLSTPATWTFDETEEYDGETYTDTYTMTISGTETINGETYTVLSSSDGEDMYFRIEDNIVYMYDPYLYIAETDNPAKTAALGKITDDEMPWMNFGVGKGKTWTIFDHSEQHEGYSWSMSQKGKYIGTESVTVPAGSYSNCMKFQMTTQSSYSGEGEQGNYLDTETFWFAKGVGPVKIISSEEENGSVSYVTTSSLKSYVKNSDGDGGGGDNGGNNDGSGAGTHAFFPLSDGANWHYDETQKDFFDNSTYTSSYASTIDGTTVINGKTYWVMLQDDGAPDAYLRIEGGILYTFAPDDVIAGKTASAIPAALKQAVDGDLTDEVPVLNLNADVGVTWDILTYTMNQQGYTITITWTGKYIGTESVTVPAGTFSNCRKYETLLTSHYSYDGGSYSYSTSSNFWLGENVGLVRIYDLEIVDGENMHEYDQKLSSYAIP